MVHFTLLGEFRVETNGVQTKIAIPRRGVALLAHVLLHGAARLHRERVASILWPDELETDGRAKLRRMLYNIAQASPSAGSAEWILAEASSIRWNDAVPRTLDVEILRAAIGSGEPVDSTSLYGGDLLAGFDEEWILPERGRLRDGHVRNLERLAKTHLNARRHGEAHDAITEVLRLEPWREDAMRFALEMRLALGDRGGALAEFDRFRDRLREDLGVDPMPETLALRDRLLAETFAPRPPDERRLAMPARSTPETVFVGRERELALLAERFAEAESGRGGLVLVGGESGVGKTELIARHARAAAERGGIVLQAATTFIETRPYQAFVTAVGAAIEQVDINNLLPATKAAIDRLLLREIPAESQEYVVDRESAAERTRLFEGVATVLDALGSRAPVVLVLEDLHWAGSDTIALCEYVARRAARSSLLIIGSYRDGDVPRSHPLRAMRRRLQEELLLAHVLLGPFSARDVQRYLVEVRGLATPDVAERFLEASGGLPIILVQLVAESIDPRTSAPATKLSTLAARLEAIPGDARTLLEVAAVVGLGFDIELIAEVSGWTETEANRRLSIALSRRVVREATNGTYDFAHHLFRELMYDTMVPAKRARRHALVAKALEDLHPNATDELASELAMHYERAGDAEHAIVALKAAARRALVVYAHEDASGFATRALDLGASSGTALELLFIREEANRFAGHRDRQRADLDLCEQFAESGDVLLLCEILRRRVDLEHLSGDRERERDVLARFETLAMSAGGVWPARAALANGRLAFEAGRHVDARVALERAAAGFELIADAPGIFESAVALAACERLKGDITALERHFSRAESELSALGNRRDLIIALYEERSNSAAFLQRYAEMSMWAQRLLDAAIETGDVGRQARAHRLLGGADAWRLNVGSAYEHLALALELSTSLGDHSYSYAIVAFRGVLEIRIGRCEAAAVELERARAIAVEHELDFGEMACAVNLSHVYSELGRYDDAVLMAQTALTIAGRIGADSMRSPALVNLGVALRELGRPREALEPLIEACEGAERERRLDLSAEAWTERALTVARIGDIGAVRTLADRARALLSELPEAVRPAVRFLTLSEAYRLSGDVSEAEAMRREGGVLVRAQIAGFPDESSREAFAGTKAHRGLLAVEADVSRTVLA